MSNKSIGRVTLLAIIGMTSTIWPILAQDFDSMSKEERKQFLAAYTEIDAIDQILPICHEIAPGYSAPNQAAMAEFIDARSIDKVRPIVERYLAWQKAQSSAAEATLKLTLGLTRTAIRAALEKEPEKCKETFKAEIFDTEFTNVAGLVEAYGLGVGGGGDVAIAAPAPAVKDVPATVAEAPATESAQPVAAKLSGSVGMPTPVADRVEELPGLSWAEVNGVDSAVGGGVYCVWRCVVLHHEDGGYPWLFIQEALPLGADKAIDQMFTLTDEYTVVGQEEIDPGDMASHMNMQPDRLVMRKASVERFGDVDRQMIFALEKGGLTTIAQLHYGEGEEGSKDVQRALSQVILSLQMDQETVLATLAENPSGMTIDAAKGAPPAPGQVIYAETPNSSMNALTLSLSYDDDVRYLDTTVLEDDGPAIDMDDSTYFYVPPQPDGATIEGVFTSADGYAGVGISVLKSETLVFNKNSRYTTSASSGVVGGFLASTGSNNKGEGSYRINGYTLELRSDDGTIQSDVFFPYLSRIFWPGSDGPADEVNFINVGGKILYRDDND